jgi:putative transposase
LITQAVQIDSQEKPMVVCNGYLPPREIMTSIGPVDIKVPKTRDRGGQGIHFRSELLPPYIKRTKSVETVLPSFISKESQSIGDFLRSTGGVIREEG